MIILNTHGTVQLEIENFRQDLDQKDVDYDATMAAKVSIAKKMYHLEKEQVFDSAAYKKYFEENKVHLSFRYYLVSLA